LKYFIVINGLYFIFRKGITGLEPKTPYFQTEIFCEDFVVIGVSYHEIYH